MVETQTFGFLLIVLSAALLAQHWHQRREFRTRRLSPRDAAFFRLQLQRRAVASALIGVVGAAMTLVDRVPRTPLAMSAYLFALLLGGAVILAIAIADLRASRRRRESEHFEMLAEELQKAQGRPRPTHPADVER